MSITKEVIEAANSSALIALGIAWLIDHEGASKTAAVKKVKAKIDKHAAILGLTLIAAFAKDYNEESKAKVATSKLSKAKKKSTPRSKGVLKVGRVIRD